MAREAAKLTKAVENLTDDNSGDLQEQIAQLKQDIANIAATLSDLGKQKLQNVKASASEAYQEAHQQSEDVFGDLKACARDLEDQLTSAVRERPVTSLATAVGIGYLLALLSRR